VSYDTNLLHLVYLNIVSLHSNTIITVPVDVQKTYFDFAIVFVIILPPLLPVLAHDNAQQLAFADQTKMIKNQFNDSPANSSSNSIVPKVVILNFYDDDIGQFTMLNQF
jgi:hypothetical protein